MQAGRLVLTSESSERGRESLCVCVCARTVFCQHMFDRCQKEKAGLMVVMPEDVEEARWEQ